MKVNSKVFRAYDVRGVVGKELSDELIENFKNVLSNSDLVKFAKFSPKDGVASVSYTHLTLQTNREV